MSISRFFIDRPIFAWVIAIGIMIAGLIGILSLPIAQYPDVAPPTVSVHATYPGASAETLETSVTQIIEQQLTGLDGLEYFTSSSTAAGTATINLTFRQGVNGDTAQVQVQNKLQQAMSRLPQEVQAQGVTVSKSNADYLLVLALYDETDKASESEIADFLASKLQDNLSRIPGVGQAQIFGSQHAMRIWLDPTKLAAVQLMPSDVQAAIQAQNVEVSAGQIGQVPALTGQMLNATVKVKSRLSTPEQFRDIVVKTQSDGSVIRLSDVARVELGQEDYTLSSRLNGHPAAGIAIQLAPGADALTTADAVKARVNELSTSFPRGYKVAYPKDGTSFIHLSINEVIRALIEAIVLVVIVMFLFLQSWRATLIPVVAVPVVLLGTFGILAVFGYSINTLTLFAMVLAIGLLVDDAIVVVENVERLMAEEGLSPHDAAIKSMDEIGSALIGVAMVLSAVFLPMAFFGGSSGVIYKQFSITIASAMLLSVVVALILSPAMAATLLKRDHRAPLERPGWFGKLNRWFDRITKRYVSGAHAVIKRRFLHLGVFALITTLMAVMFLRLPTAFLPQEDQGSTLVIFTLPAGATMERTNEVREQVQRYYLTREKKAVAVTFAMTGYSFNGAGQNAGMGFTQLAPFDQRTDRESSADAVNLRAMQEFAKVRDAQVVSMAPPPIAGLGRSNGFTFELLNTGNLSRSDFAAIRDRLLEAANRDPSLSAVRAAALPDMPQLRIALDEPKLAVLGLSENDVIRAVSDAWGSSYVNDFVDQGRVKRVFIQADAQYRMLPDDLSKWYVRSSQNGEMIPFSAFATTSWEMGPTALSRFNGIASFEIQGEGAPGTSSGQAMKRMEMLHSQLPPGTSFAWSGLSLQEKESSGKSTMLYALSILVVFMCLAALYESWSIPLAVLMVLPLGVIGAVLAVTARQLNADIYFQVGLVTTLGLAAKNAVLIVEFAEEARRAGKHVVEASLEAARVRFRPILMTSLAFIFGVLPLAMATGAGANSRIAIGTAVIGGMLTATVLAIFYVPMFYVVISRLFHREQPQGPVATKAVVA